MTVFKRLRQAIDQGYVTMNYWQNPVDPIPKKVRTVTSCTNASFISILKKNAEKQWAGHWQLMYDRLVEYLRVNGHTNVSKYDTKNKQLGIWVKTQRHEYTLLSNGKKSRMKMERIQLLEEIGFKWRIRNLKWYARGRRLYMDR